MPTSTPLPDGSSVLPKRRRVALVGHTVAGIETQFRNVRQVASSIPGLEPAIVAVSPYRADDLLERRFRFLSPATRGTLRSLWATSQMFGLRDLDGVWTQVDVPLLPWMVAGSLFRPVPTLYSCDSTPKLLRELGPHYEVAVTRSPTKRALRNLCFRYVLGRVTLFNPWTEWAARSLQRDYGIPRSRIQVLSPGVDLAFWHAPDRREVGGGAGVPPLRLLFVGGDFVRKGGDLLLDVFRQQLRGRVEIDLVTRQGAQLPDPGVRVHTGLSPNNERLVALYRNADMFVLPTRADCYSMAAMEAMASGLPVIICPVGGVAEVLDSGRQGFFVEPDDGRALAQAILTLVNDPVRRRAMGASARALAVSRYDAAVNARKLFERLLLEGRPRHPEATTSPFRLGRRAARPEGDAGG